MELSTLRSKQSAPSGRASELFILWVCLTPWVEPPCHRTRAILQFYKRALLGRASASPWPSQLALPQREPL